MIEGGVEFLPHEKLDQEGGASDVHRLDAELILSVELEVRTGVLDDYGIVAFGLVAGVLLVVDDLPFLIVAVNYPYCQPNSAFFLAGSQNAKFGLEGLLGAGVLCRGTARRGSIWCGWRGSAREGCPGPSRGGKGGGLLFLAFY